jgi:hypothetical protein
MCNNPVDSETEYPVCPNNVLLVESHLLFPHATRVLSFWIDAIEGVVKDTIVILVQMNIIQAVHREAEE